ncbi:MAG TPA: serine hydrolase [Pyrinomonadaceae bacterium]|nr:serine hydrolase [Pyrinomonadaceae bacterium]
MSNDPISQIQQLIDNHAATKAIGVVAGLVSPSVQDGATLLFAGADGFLNTKHDPLVLDGNTLFKLASLTKIFTSVVQFQNHGDYAGKLSDFITVKDYPLPEPIGNLPILDLANYSPGFPTDTHVSWVGSQYLQNLPALLGFLVNTPNIPQNTPGTCYSYSNFGWALLGLVALGVSDASVNIYGEWQTSIASLGKAVGFTNTAPYDASMNVNLAVGHYKNGSMLPPNANYGLQNPMLFGAGGVVTTGNDMLKWLQLHMGQGSGSWEKMLQQQQQERWQRAPCQPVETHKGPVVSLGWFHRTENINGSDVTFLWKDGAHLGFTTWMGFERWIDTASPSSTGCFVLTNSVGADQLGLQIINILLGNSNPVVSTTGVHRVEEDE